MPVFPLHPDSLTAPDSATTAIPAPDSIATPALLAAPAERQAEHGADGHLWQKTVAVISGHGVPDSTAGQPPTLASIAMPGGPGYTGTPTPYTYRHDDGMTAAILACLLLALVVLSRSGFYLTHRLREMLHAHSHSVPDSEHTGNEAGGFLALTGMTCVLWGLIYCQYLTGRMPAIFSNGSPYILAAVTAGCMALFYAAKFALYSAVNAVFFARQQRRDWAETYLLHIVATGLLLIPAVVTMTYTDRMPEQQVAYCAGVIIMGKLMLFYRCHRTFFTSRNAWVHNFLYFCTLEVIPALMLWRALFWAVGKTAIKYLYN